MLKTRKDLGWFGSSAIFLTGILLLAGTYAAYKDAAWQDTMAIQKPIVCMKIVERSKGAGTVKFPDKIYAQYNGKIYHFEMGSKYYRNLIGVDTIAVNFDSVSGKAVLPITGRVWHYAFLYFMIAGVSIMGIWGSILEFKRLARAIRIKRADSL